MVMPIMTVVLVVKVMVVLVKTLVIDVWAEMVMDTLPGVEVILVTAATIALEFALDVSFDIAVDAFMPTLMSAWEFAMPTPCRPLRRILQAWMPWYHVWRSFALSALPQFLNQEPP